MAIKHTLKCEVCRKEKATILGFIFGLGWRVMCFKHYGPNNPFFYDIEFNRINDAMTISQWFDHLSEKNWFIETAKEGFKRKIGLLKWAGVLP
jgi:hypothetical protein